MPITPPRLKEYDARFGTNSHKDKMCFTANDVSVVLEVVGVPQSQFVFLHSSSLSSCLSLNPALYLPCNTDCHISEILIDTTIKVKDYGMCNIAFTMSCQCTIALHEFTRYNP